MITAGIDPISQFNLSKIFEFRAFGLDLSFTNSSLFMIVAVALICLWMALSTGKLSLIPSRAQSIVEMSYEFVADMLRSSAGKDGLKFFPFVFTLFIFILFANMLGMFPYFFTTTSHIIVTFVLAMMVMAVVLGYGLWKHGFGFFKLFAPAGLPLPTYLLLTPIEIISFLSRPISLAIRLWANVFAGHILLKLFAAFAVALATASGLGFKLMGIIPFIMAFALTPLELLVAFVQAYVFALLTCVYLSDALHPGHH